MTLFFREEEQKATTMDELKPLDRFVYNHDEYMVVSGYKSNCVNMRTGYLHYIAGFMPVEKMEETL